MAANEPPLPPGFTRESTIRIDRNGGIWHDGQLVTHPGLAEAFARWLDVDPESGRYIIRNQINWVYVTVDDTPLVVRSTAIVDDDDDDGDGRVWLALSDGTREELARPTLRLDENDVPYCTVRGGALPARFLPAAAFTLLEALGPEAERLPRVPHGAQAVQP
jgi:uncharacterized protein